MHCTRCGASLSPGATACAACGQPVTSGETQSARSPAGLPVGRYIPSSYGPPVRPDVVPRASAIENEAPSRRVFGYRPVDLPPPLPARGGALRRALWRLCVLALLLVVVLTAVNYARGARPLNALFGHTAPHSLPVAASRPTATATTLASCPAVPIDASAARALSHVQLTTGLRNAASHDYRPVNAVSAFQQGQTVYITFQLATEQAGSVGVMFCTSSERITGSLDVLPGSSGRYGEFATQFASGDTGQGRVVLTWNGSGAAQLPFTITP